MISSLRGTPDGLGGTNSGKIPKLSVLQSLVGLIGSKNCIALSKALAAYSAIFVEVGVITLGFVSGFCKALQKVVSLSFGLRPTSKLAVRIRTPHNLSWYSI